MSGCQLEYATLFVMLFQPSRTRNFPVKFKHVAFLKFLEKTYPGVPTAAELSSFVASQHLKVFIETLRTPGLGNSHIVRALQEAFPRRNDRRWIQTDAEGTKCNLVYNSYTWLNGAFVGTPLIIVLNIPGLDGDGDECTELNRIYSNYALSDVHIMQSGAPCFLVSILGLDVTIWGAFTENVWQHAETEIEVFETVFRGQDSTVNYQELATQFLALQDAVEYLPKIHFGHGSRIPNLPNALTTFEDLSGVARPLRFERQLEDRCCMFLASAHTESIMVKLTFCPYSYGVHEVLHAAGFGPKLLGRFHSPAIGADAIIMEWLPPPTQNESGWMTVHNLFRTSPGLVYLEQTDILEKLNEIIDLLQLNKKVHGGLGTDNLMVLVTFRGRAIVKPVQMKVVDMSWAGNAGETFYPVKFSDRVGYPGQPGAVVDTEDHAYMAAHWKKFFNSTADYSLWRIL